MQADIESMLYAASQIFMIPVLVAVAALFFYAFYAVGGFLWQAYQRRTGQAAGFDLMATWRANRRMNLNELETVAFPAPGGAAHRHPRRTDAGTGGPP
jgi:hypothetical protein